jgi:hypothetical protein
MSAQEKLEENIIYKLLVIDIIKEKYNWDEM